jgi:outer membrane protein TolC
MRSLPYLTKALLLLLTLHTPFGQSTAAEKAPSAVQKIYTLEECIQASLENNSDIRLARQDLEVNKGLIMQAKAVLYPTVQSDSRLFYQDEDLFKAENTDVRNSRFQDNWFISLQVQKNIYSAGVNQNQIEISELQNEISTVKLQEIINSVAYETSVAFYDILLNQSNLSTRKQNIDLLEKELKRQQALFEAGHAMKFNVVRTEVRLMNERPGLVQVENTTRIAKMTLLQLMGAAIKNTDFQVVGNLDYQPYNPDVEQLVNEALNNSPELTREEKQIEVSKRQLAIAKAALVPTLDFFAGSRLREDQSSSSFLDNTAETSFGLMGHWNIFDGFASKGAAIQAKTQIEKGGIQRETVARKIEYDIRKACLNLKEAESSLISQKENVQMAKEAIHLAESSVDAGFGTQFDILQATVDYMTAQDIELEARYQYSVAMAQLEKARFSRVRWNSKESSTTTTVKRLAPSVSK